MSVSLICPTCGTPTTIHRPPVSVCPQCQSAWPEPLRMSAEASLTREKAARPILLTIGMYLAVPFGALLLFLVLLAPFNAATYTIQGERVTGSEFLRRAGVMFGTLGASALAIAYAIWRELSWSRWAMMAFWLVQLPGAIGFGWADAGLGGAASAVASLFMVVILAAWYLFGKENVVEYYRALQKAETAAEARRSSR